MKVKSKKRKARIEWGLAIALIFFVFLYSPFVQFFHHLTPKGAYEFSEKTYHYGPSDIIAEVKVDSNLIIYLSRYKDWYSVSHTVRDYGFVWRHRGGSGVKIEEEKEISYHFGSAAIEDDKLLTYVGGIVTDPNIEKIELELEDDVKTSPLNDENMFLLMWEEDFPLGELRKLKGLNEKGETVYEYSHPRLEESD